MRQFKDAKMMKDKITNHESVIESNLKLGLLSIFAKEKISGYSLYNPLMKQRKKISMPI